MFIQEIKAQFLSILTSNDRVIYDAIFTKAFRKDETFFVLQFDLGNTVNMTVNDAVLLSYENRNVFDKNDNDSSLSSQIAFICIVDKVEGSVYDLKTPTSITLRPAIKSNSNKFAEGSAWIITQITNLST